MRIPHPWTCCLLAGLILLPASAVGRELKQWVQGFNVDDRGLEGSIPNDKAFEFMERNVPRFACPDEELERTYDFRWWTFRKHIRELHGYTPWYFHAPEPDSTHLTIQWDRDGRKYDNGAGFRIFVDGELIGSSYALDDLTLKLP